MGRELNLPLGTRDSTAPHPPVHRELPKSWAKAGPPLEAQRSRSREPGASCVHQSQQGKIQHPPTTETAVINLNEVSTSEPGLPVMQHAPRGTGRATYPRRGPRERHEAEMQTWLPPRHSSRGRLLLPARLLISLAAPRAPLRSGTGGAALASSPPAGRDPFLSALLSIRNNLSA